MYNLHIEIVEKKDYPRLLEIWVSAVKATHHFLLSDDFEFFKNKIISEYLPNLEVYKCICDDNILGFAGIDDNKLEMLFVDALYRGKGVGKKLLQYVVTEQNITSVDVNEQNVDAYLFYKKNGFRNIGRTECDSYGKPYPIINMIID